MNFNLLNRLSIRNRIIALIVVIGIFCAILLSVMPNQARKLGDPHAGPGSG